MKDNSDWLEEKCREVIKNLPTRNGYYIVNPNKDCTSLEFAQAIRKQIEERLPEEKNLSEELYMWRDSAYISKQIVEGCKGFNKCRKLVIRRLGLYS